MEYNKYIGEMGVGDEVQGFYILKSAFPKTTAAGKPFLSAVTACRAKVAAGVKIFAFCVRAET